MPHFGMICPSASGHLNPMTTLGNELVRRGHRVTLFCIEDAEPKATAAGLDFVPVGQRDFPRGTMHRKMAELGRLSGAPALRYTLELFTTTTRCILEETPQVIRGESVDALLVDQSSFGGAEVAKHLELPFVSVCCALLFNREINAPPINTDWSYRPDAFGRLRNWLGYKLVEHMTRSLKEMLQDYRRKWKLPLIDDPNEMFSDLAQICQQPAEFEFPRRELPRTFHFTGPYANASCRESSDFPWDRLDDRPLIYASLGTLQNRLVENYRVIAEACSELPAQLVIALGGGSEPESMPELPGKPLLVGYAPQLDLLPRSRLTITHAGMNTTLESLQSGVPMVAIPITNDQPGVASRIAWSGAGEFVPLRRLSVPRLRSAIERVWETPGYRQNAERLKDAIQKAGGTSRAADIVEQVAATGQAVYRVEP